jgi:hypothetical protein
MKNAYSHLYLYAKHHYKRTNVVEDLKVICGKICGCDPEHMYVDDVMYWCLKTACKHLQEDKKDLLDIFREFLSDISPDNCWKTGCSYKPYSFELAVIHKCLSVLSMVSVREPSTNTILLELDEPDPNLLPLRRNQHE